MAKPPEGPRLQFTEREALEAWLKTQPREVSVAIAARAALRILPLAVRNREGIDEARLLLRQFAESISTMLPATAVAWVAAKYPTRAHELRTATSYAAAYVAAATFAAATAVTAAAFAAPAAAAADYAARAADDAAGSADAAWAAVARDASFIASGGSAPALASMQLWPDGAPDWASEYWARLREALLREDDWHVWIDWYQKRLDGVSDTEEIEFVYATVPEEKWKEGPAAANAWIKARLEELRPPWSLTLWSLTLSTVIETPFTNRWIVDDNQFAIDPKGDESDVAASREAVTRQLHEALERKAGAFAQLCAGIDERLGWTGFEAAIGRFNTEISRDIDDIPNHIASVYDATVELGSFLEYDSDLRRDGHRIRNISPLDPDIRRAFSDLIRTAAPWVRGFPTARDLDDATGAFFARPELFEPASSIVKGASERALISDHDRDLLLALLAALERSGLPAHKAGVRGVQSAKGLTFKALAVLAAFYSGAVSSDFATKSKMVGRIGDFLAARETEIAKLLADHPVDIRLAVRAALDNVKRDNAPDAGGADPAILPRRKDEEE